MNTIAYLSLVLIASRTVLIGLHLPDFVSPSVLDRQLLSQPTSLNLPRCAKNIRLKIICQFRTEQPRIHQLPRPRAGR